ncbi:MULTISPECIES: SMI1/KNR4 family protein [unclassified Bacillus (in: firmicutes)]|uniref:SMI1/KNR4 family protein n=1 Tax=unclassified Bacillus (in: firmicutes) TaxID=185979 RepID=UPI0008F3E892|nr:MULTISPECIES: SMI1/KNR4 family protein [unclassified Bacillus (in: firmicutes)]SFA85889.1 SMI1 / KNR4 family (SUKH-1) [Bacillus sp. UNCCL13]SFQ83541.1 SMI1 / KNR4 family (SUKH-1) [Bacillus sp. cl95]
MKEFSIANILETLKTRLDENSLLHVQCRFGIYPKKGFVFKNPIAIEKLENLIMENGLNLPTNYKEFLLLHNGAEFFTYEYGNAFCLYSLEEMIHEYDKMLYYYHSTYYKQNCYPIGYVTDIGPILIDHSKFNHSDKENVLLIGIETIDFSCDLKTWLERMIISEGHLYWEWYSKVVEYE